MPGQTLLQPPLIAAQFLAQILSVPQEGPHCLVTRRRHVHSFALVVAQHPRDHYRVAAVLSSPDYPARAIDDGAVSTYFTLPFFSAALQVKAHAAGS